MRRLLVSSLCALALLGCGSASAGLDGRVTGSIRLCGGPAPGRCFDQDGTVSVLGRHDRLVATQRAVHAHFAFALPAGSYTLVARTGGTRGQRQVRIKAGRTLRVNVVIAVP
jgi:hypothetical protein